VSYKSHLRIPSEGANYKYACHVERNAYPSMVISGVVNPYGVDCKNCKRTKAFDQSMKAAEAA
jgi:hypothetical protein